MVESEVCLRKYRRIRQACRNVPVQLSLRGAQGHVTNISSEPEGIPVQSSSTPAAGPLSSVPYITTDTESGECRVHRSLYVKTPEPIRLHPLDFLDGEHGVVDVPIVLEYRVVAPHSGGVYAS